MSVEQSMSPQPTTPARPARKRWGGCLTRWLFALSGLIPLLALINPQPDPVLLIYSAFVLLALVRPRPVPAPGQPRYLRFVLLLIGAGLCLEVLAWLNNFIACNPDPALLHPQLLPDLALGVAFYGSWAAAWLPILRRFRFGFGSIIITQGLYGVLLEQRGAIFLLGLTTLPIGLVFWIYVFVTYGSVIGIALLLNGTIPGYGDRDRWYKYPLALLLTLAASLLITGVWGGLMGVTGVLPPRLPICERPLW